ARPGVRPLWSARPSRRGRHRLPALRAPRGTTLSTWHRRLHAPGDRRRRADGGTGRARRGPMRVPAVAAVVLASGGGARLASALASVAWAGERIVLDPAARLTREPLPRGVRLHAGVAERLGEAVEHLDAQATTLAALLAERRCRPRLWHLVLGPLAAGGHTLVARPVRQRGSARWFLAVLAGYRAAVAYAKLWERRRAES